MLLVDHDPDIPQALASAVRVAESDLCIHVVVRRLLRPADDPANLDAFYVVPDLAEVLLGRRLVVHPEKLTEPVVIPQSANLQGTDDKVVEARLIEVQVGWKIDVRTWSVRIQLNQRRPIDLHVVGRADVALAPTTADRTGHQGGRPQAEP